MKKRILENLKKMRNPEIRNYKNFLEEAIEYVESTDEPNTRLINVDWLQRRIWDDVVDGNCDGLVFEKLNKYIHEYEAKDGN